MSLPTHRQIRAAIAANIVAAQANTKVHLFERYLASLGTLKAEYVDATNGLLIGCHIRRTATRRTAPSVGRYHTRHQWQVRFYMALDDSNASELAFDDWIEAVAAVFRADATLGGLAASTAVDDSENTEGLQLIDTGPVMFCGVLSHSAKCQMQTLHFH